MPRGRGRGFHKIPFGEDKKHFGGNRYDKHREGRSRSGERNRRRERFSESSDPRRSSKSSSYSKSSRDKRHESSYERHKKSRKARSSKSHSDSDSSSSSRSNSSDSSSSNERSYTKSPTSKVSNESSKRQKENYPTSPVRQQVVRGPPVYSAETQIQPGGWYPPNQNFTAGAASHPRPFQQPQPSNYPNEENFNQNYPNQNFNGSYYPNYYPPVNNSFAQPSGAPSVHDYTIPSQGNWESNVYPDISLPPPVIVSGNNVEIATQPTSSNDLSNLPDHKKEAVEQEMLQQKKTLSKQREDYVRKSISLNKELNRLKDQKNDLLKEKSSEDTERILRENAKLQGEIQQKLKAITNVVEMLTGIIGDNRKMADIHKEIITPQQPEPRKKESRKVSSDESPCCSPSPVLEKKKSEKSHLKELEKVRSSSSSPDVVVVRQPKLLENTKSQKVEKSQMNLVHYDPEIHWCSSCNVFPKTYTDFLIHLHSDQHSKGEKETEDLCPWHQTEFREKSPTFNKSLPSKRVPIRGVQFMVPSSGWFCKLCKIWLGDLHCAANHLRSLTHSEKYNEYTANHPHWEVDWMSDRTKSYERFSEQKSWMRNAPEGSSKLSPPPPPSAPPPPSVLAKKHSDVNSATLSSITTLSDQLLAMLTANTAAHASSALTAKKESVERDFDSSSSSDDSSSSGEKSKKKEKKKKKKSKKSKRKKEKEDKPKKLEKSPDHENHMGFIESEYEIPVKQQVHQKIESKPDDKIINEWMVSPAENLKKDIYSLKGRIRERSESEEPSQVESFMSRIDKRGEREKYTRGKHSKNDHFGGRDSQETSGDSKDSKGGGKERNIERRDKRDSAERRDYRDSKERREYRGRDNRESREHRKRIEEKDKKSVERVVEEKHVRPEKPQGKIWAPGKGDDEDDNTETIFEKRTSESAAKKKDSKKVPFMTLPKSKLPFIGRMPILKKKNESKSDDGVNSKENDKKEEKFYEWPEIPVAPEPPVISDNPNALLENPSPLPKSTLIISKRPRLAEPEVSKKEVLFDNLGVQDMDIADEDAPQKDELHKDFKEALDILFPDPADKENAKDGDKDAKEDAADAAPALPSTYVGMSVNYMVPDASGMYTPEQQSYMAQYAQYSGDPAYLQQYLAYAQQSGYMIDPNAYAQVASTPQAPLPAGPSPEAPPPPIISEGSKEDSDGSPPTKKKKNPPSQRYRRHLAKKKAEQGDVCPPGEGEDEEDGEDGLEEEREEAEEKQDQEKSKPTFVPKTDMSDLALLGIDEEDTFAQSFA